MSAKTCLAYLFGRESAIGEVAGDKAALSTGLVLVLLTAIARNYDQTFIGEKPFLWLFGPLLFSLVSGTWIYLAAYGGCVIRWSTLDGGKRPRLWSGWRSFMGLFWMTAPIAWLYALPVERFFDSLTSAQLNIALLSIVSCWRVLLMARVLTVLCRTPTRFTFFWVLAPAAIEVLVVIILGGALSRAVLASMSGMRNSPEETVLQLALGIAVNATILLGPSALCVAALWKPKSAPTPLPAQEAGVIPWRPLAAATGFWILAAVLPQQELVHNAEVDNLVRAGQWRAALDAMSKHNPGDYAPSRTLPPKPYEHEVFHELPHLLNTLKESDPPWLRDHLFKRLNEMFGHFYHWGRSDLEDAGVILALSYEMIRVRPVPSDMLVLINGLQAAPEGRVWLGTNTLLLQALGETFQESLAPYNDPAKKAAWLSDRTKLLDKLLSLGITNSVSETSEGEAAKP